MYYHAASEKTKKTTFLHNTADEGGGMYNDYSSPTITNTTFSYNTAGNSGGGMLNVTSYSPTIPNTTYVYNTAGTFYDLDRGGITNIDSSPIITNNTFWVNLDSG